MKCEVGTGRLAHKEFLCLGCDPEHFGTRYLTFGLTNRPVSPKLLVQPINTVACPSSIDYGSGLQHLRCVVLTGTTY